ncbi:uncharacterized protein si:dkey-19b23.7 isoform X2 [Coregonus clupeaformis]|uniref:uncharacterized protein si:dkey-19b23.7 isoform X2 n=1 Tax=Coregonus clupeaformis TaxID=59861 RepID=UPI001BE04F30|nr:uncharacterized protein si:dkey-19b23.7 isoform X2 [Coregonus clupeaformis]
MKTWVGVPLGSWCRQPPPSVAVPHPAAPVAPTAWLVTPAPPCLGTTRGLIKALRGHKACQGSSSTHHRGPTTMPTSEASCKGSSEAHLLPASPSEREIAVPEVNCTLFLLAGYAKYGRPYAWIRSNHERLVNIGGTDSMVKDTPMKLKAITDWGSQGIRVWDVVSELVCLCTVPSPSNPFALDMRYLKNLPLPERFLVSGALLNFLETYAVYGNRDELHYDKVVEEVKSLRRLHVQTLSEVQRRPGRSTRPATPASGESSEEE